MEWQAYGSPFAGATALQRVLPAQAGTHRGAANRGPGRGDPPGRRDKSGEDMKRTRRGFKAARSHRDARRQMPEGSRNAPQSG